MTSNTPAINNNNQNGHNVNDLNSELIDVLVSKVGGITADDTRTLQDQRTTQYLRLLGGGNERGEELIVSRQDGGKQVLKPADMSNATLSVEAAKADKAERSTVHVPKQFFARPDDGAVAFMNVLKALYGFSPTGVTQYNPFTGEPIYPTFRQVPVGKYTYNESTGKWDEETVRVPESLMSFSRGDFKFTFQLTSSNDEDFGYCFHVNIWCKQGDEEVIKGILKLVERYLEENSIYRGKVLEGVGRISRNGIVEPKFKNPWETRDIPLFFEKEVSIQIQEAIYSILEKTEMQRKGGSKIGSTTIMAGDPGTGKSETIIKAVKAAMNNKETVTVLNGTGIESQVERSIWTVVYVKPEEDFNLVTSFARKVGGCVLLISEDAEYRGEFQNKEERAKFLAALDGLGSKGSEVMKIFTTNKPEAFEDETGATFRAERVDDFIEIGLPDFDAATGMIASMIPESQREGEFNWDLIWEHCAGYTLAWIAGGVKRSRRSAIDRTNDASPLLSDQDIVHGLISMRRTHERYLKARQVNETVTIEDIFTEILEDKVSQVVDTRLALHKMNRNDDWRIEKIDA